MSSYEEDTDLYTQCIRLRIQTLRNRRRSQVSHPILSIEKAIILKCS